MFWSIINDYDITTALTELVDNSIDTWMAKKNRGQLTVSLELDIERQLIVLSDNAGGVSRPNLRYLITPGGARIHQTGNRLEFLALEVSER